MGLKYEKWLPQILTTGICNFPDNFYMVNHFTRLIYVIKMSCWFPSFGFWTPMHTHFKWWNEIQTSLQIYHDQRALSAGCLSSPCLAWLSHTVDFLLDNLVFLLNPKLAVWASALRNTVLFTPCHSHPPPHANPSCSPSSKNLTVLGMRPVEQPPCLPLRNTKQASSETPQEPACTMEV